MSYYHNNHYKIVVCPQCGHREAYYYSQDVKKALEKGFDSIMVTCNRKNKCGWQGQVKLEDLGYNIDGLKPSERAKEIKAQLKKEEQRRFEFRKTSREGLMDMVSLRHKGKPFPMETYRGIKAETFNRPNITYLPQGFEAMLQASPHYPTIGEAFKSSTYTGRDLLFWVNDWSGRPNRIVMRSLNLTSESDRKEASLVLPIKQKDLEIPLQRTKDRSGKVLYTIWNGEAVLDDPYLTHLMACEGIYDALSLMELTQEEEGLEIVSLIGVSQTKRLMQLIEAYQIKYGTVLDLIIAYDNDTAGNKFAKQAAEHYKRLFNKNATRLLPGSYEDFNEYYQQERTQMIVSIGNQVKEILNNG